jgi:cytochrome c peroxidase
LSQKISLVRNAAILAAIAALSVSCDRKQPHNPANESEMVPALPEQSYDYPASNNDKLATLGRVLFYDKQLSLHNNISCGSCHMQEKAFCDNKQFSEGTDGLRGKRNAPIIFPKEGRLFWDGRANSLNDMVLRPVKDPLEMNQHLDEVLAKISKLDYYQTLFKQAFSSFSRADSNHIQLALAEFIRNFTFNNTRFIRSKRGEVQLTATEVEGQKLFFGDARCGQCHHVDGGFGGSGYGTTNEFHNIGLDEVYTDPGVGKVNNSPAQDGAFMMPVLLNIEHTAPYMHDGRFATLEEVVEHYNSKIKNHPNLDPKLRDWRNNMPQPIRLELTASEKASLVAFLKTLSDPSFMTDPKFSDPFIPRP